MTLDATLGAVFCDDEELELAPLNFKAPLHAENNSNGRIDVTLTGEGFDIVAGYATVKDSAGAPKPQRSVLKMPAQIVPADVAGETALALSGVTLADGSVPFTANQSMGSHKLTTLANGATGTQEAATVAQVEGLIAAAVSTIADWKQSVRLATATAMAASTRVGNVRTANANGAMATIDGAAPAVGNRILDKSHATSADRGVWTVTSLGSAGSPWVLTRATDADADAEVTPGFTVAIEEGTANKGHVFVLTTAAPFTVNTSGWTFVDLGQIAGDGTTIQIVAGVASIVAGGVAAAQLAARAATFAKLPAASAAGKVFGSTAAGDFQEMDMNGGLERNGTAFQVASQLPSRGGENVAIDLYPSTQQQGTIATAATTNIDVAIATGRRYQITADVWVDDGAGGAVIFVKSLFVRAHQTGGVAVLASTPVVIDDNAAANWTFTATANGTNVRFALTNTSGTTRSYNIAIGYWVMDKP